MALATGTRGSHTTGITAAQRKIDVQERVLDLQPNAQPLTVLSSRLNRRPCVNSKYSHFEDDLLPRYDRVNNGAGYAAGATSIVVDNGAYFQVDDLVFISRTGEMIRVDAAPSGNTLGTVARGVGSTAAAIVDNDELIIVGSSKQEGATARTSVSTLATEVVNYTEIFERTASMTETLRHSDQFTRPHEWDRSKEHVALEHQKDKEFAFIFGQASNDTTGTQPRTSTGGVLDFISTNQTDVGGTMTETEFFTALRAPFRYSNNPKLLLSAPLAVDVLNTYPRGKVQVTDQGDNSYGVRVVRYISPHGDANVVTHWQLEGDKYGGYIIILDLAAIQYRYLANENGSRDTHWLENIDTPATDARRDQILAEVGLQFGNEKKHGLISNITG